MHFAKSQTALCYVDLMCTQGEKKKLLHKYFEDIAKLLQLLLRNTNFPLFFFKVYITTLP